jgi:hypothetical protein
MGSKGILAFTLELYPLPFTPLTVDQTPTDYKGWQGHRASVNDLRREKF